MNDPADSIAETALGMWAKDIALGEDFYSELVARAVSPSPLKFLVQNARARAMKAMVDLVDANPEDCTSIRNLQSDVLIYRQIVVDIKHAVMMWSEGSEQVDKASILDTASMIYNETGASYDG